MIKFSRICLLDKDRAPFSCSRVFTIMEPLQHTCKLAVINFRSLVMQVTMFHTFVLTNDTL